MILLCCALLTACSPLAAQAPIADQWRTIAVEAKPVELGAEHVGVLQFRGGLELTSPEARFGGWSGMEVLEDGRLVAVSDDGLWLSARLVFDPEGALAGLSQARIAALRGVGGVAFEHKRDGDAEDLAQLPDGRFAVSFEQSQSILIYDLNRDGPFGAAARGPALGEVERLPANAGLEALAAADDGELIAGAEESGRIWRARLDSQALTPPAARYRLRDGFSLVSLDRLPDGDDLIALERFYAPVIGVRTRITRIDMHPFSDPVRVAEWALLAPPLALDNFEAISAVHAPGGGLRLYILSDDNFSPHQRTLLYAFDVALD